MADWNLVEKLGGEARFEELVTDFYDRLFDDVIIGFFFQPHDKDRLIRSQMNYLHAHLGDRSGTYDGPTIRKAHAQLPILVGHFDRRHQILRDVLETWDVPDEVATQWLDLDLALRKFVVNLGAEERDRILQKENPRDEDPEG